MKGFCGLLILIALAGCKSVAGPDMAHPGRAEIQQKRALRYDPYPETDAAPAMTGVRPRDYQNALPETSRSRWVLDKNKAENNTERWKTQGIE